MKNCYEKFFIYTHRPNGNIQKLYYTLSKHFYVDFISLNNYESSRGPVYVASLNKNFSSFLQLSKNALFSIPKIRQGVKIVDVIDSGFFPTPLEDKIMVWFSTPLHVEMEWFGYSKPLIKYMKFAQDTLIRKAELVIAYNEMMGKYCEETGASKVVICPNYPTRNFKPTSSKEMWLTLNNLPKKARFALFVAGGRMLEVYGLELLLRAWVIIEKEFDDAHLIIIGPAPKPWINQFVEKSGMKHLIIVGLVSPSSLPNWVNIADVCLAPRTPCFPSEWYNDKDSTKISESAALKKPIVAAGYFPSNQYLLVDRTPQAFAEGIMKALEGKVKPAEPHYWEENEEKILKMIGLFAKEN